MMTMEKHEHDGARLAGKAGGEYLDSIGIYDMSKLTPHQWETFIETICVKFKDESTRLLSLMQDDEIPF